MNRFCEVVLLISLIAFSTYVSVFSIVPSTVLADSSPPKIKYDDAGIPLTYYGNQSGYQRNPVTISLYLIKLCDDYKLNNTNYVLLMRYIKNNANWLIVNAKQHGNYSLYDFNFPFTYSMSPPWHSALAQGFAIQGLVRAHQITKNATYLDATLPILNSFYIEVRNGGITEKTQNTGWWYEEYADIGGQNPQVLNGMMYDLVALHEYFNYTHNANAKFLFDKGVAALKSNISNYDNKGSQYYDARKTTSPISYQEVHVNLLMQLYEITGEPILKKYLDKWEPYLAAEKNNSTAAPEFSLITSLVITASFFCLLIIPRMFGSRLVKSP